MSETDAGPRAGLFPEGPILDVPFAIAMAASALRRFTTGDLAACSGRPEAEVEAWIEANADTLQVVEDGVPWDPGETAWRRTPEADTGFAEMLRAMDPLELHVRLHGEWRQRVDRLEAVDHAEFYAEASESCEAGVDVDECRDRALEWLRVADRLLDGHRAVDSVVSEGLPKRIAALRTRLDGMSPVAS